jgi:D-3-phosphoglycerate dehydrogenase
MPNVIGWELKAGSRRIINIHRNVRGFMKEISALLSQYNVGKQVLETKDGYGYLIVDINAENVTNEIVGQLALLSSSIRTRIV